MSRFFMVQCVYYYSALPKRG